MTQEGAAPPHCHHHVVTPAMELVPLGAWSAVDLSFASLGQALPLAEVPLSSSPGSARSVVHVPSAVAAYVECAPLGPMVK